MSAKFVTCSRIPDLLMAIKGNAQTLEHSQTELVEPHYKIPTLWALGATLLVALGYFWYSTKSEGMYQQDEAGHFTSMLTIWHAPEKILTNWAKPGYKVLYAIPALFGRDFVVFLNCLLAALSGFFAFKAAEKQGASTPAVAFLLLVTQPLWVELAFRNYSEIPSAFLLSLAYYFWVSKKELFTGLIAGYICTIRQEFIPIAGLFGLALLYRKSWVAAFSIALFPIGQHVWGWLTFDDPLFLYNQIFGQSKELADIYPRKGFDHYLKTSIVIFGASAVTYFVTYLGAKAFNKKQPDWFLVTPIIIYVLINCLFNWQSRPVGPSTGGNLRYLLFVSPLVAVAGTLAWDEVLKMKERWKLALVLVPLLLIVYSTMNFQHNYIELIDKKDTKPGLFVILSGVAIAFALRGWLRTGVVAGLCLLVMFTNVRPKAMSEEDITCRDVAKWYLSSADTFDKEPLLVEHPMVYYYIGRSPYNFPIEPKTMTKAHIDSAKAGTLILWDSHYSFRAKRNANQYNYDYMANQPERFKLVQEFIAKDQTFGIIAFQKLKQ